MDGDSSGAGLLAAGCIGTVLPKLAGSAVTGL
jgi:hypothetical protein